MESDNNSKSVSVEKDLKELTTEEFKTKFISWYQNRGLVTEMRSHLRHQMISALRETQVGQAITDSTKQPISPKIQAIHLLIAEFFLYQQNHYTLSIYVSEMSFLSSYPELMPTNESVRDVQLPKFKKSVVIDILDTFGLTQHTREGEKILRMYLKHKSEALLTILFRCLCEYPCVLENADSPEISDPQQLEHYTAPQTLQWNAAVHEILIKSQVKGTPLHQIKDRICRMYQAEVERLSSMEAAKCKTIWAEREAALRAEAKCTEQKLIAKAGELEQKYYKYKNNCANELKHKQQILENLAQQLHQQFAIVTFSMDNFEKQSDALNSREQHYNELCEQKEKEVLELAMEVQKKSSIISEREQHTWYLQKLLDKVQLESKTTAENFLVQINQLEKQVSTLQGELNEERKRGNDNEMEFQTLQENGKAVHDLYVEVKEENEMLRNRLNEFTNRSEQLNRNLQSRNFDLDDSLSTDRFAAAAAPGPAFYLPDSRSGATTSLQPEQSQSRNNNATNTRLGGGEESFQPSRGVSPIYRHVTHARHSRDGPRRVPRRLVVHSSPSSESSLTEDILQDAKHRLRKLEEDTKKVEAKYESYRTRSPVRFVDLFRFATESMKQPKISNDSTPSIIFPPDLSDIVRKMTDFRKNEQKTSDNSIPLMSEALPLYFTAKTDSFMPPKDNQINSEKPESLLMETSVTSVPISEQNMPFTFQPINTIVNSEQLSSFFNKMKSTIDSFDSTAFEVSKSIELLAKSSCQLSKDIMQLPTEIEDKSIIDALVQETETPAENELNKAVDSDNGSSIENKKSPHKSTGAIKKTYITKPVKTFDEDLQKAIKSKRKYFHLSCVNPDEAGTIVRASPRFSLPDVPTESNYTEEISQLRSSLYDIDEIETEINETRSNTNIINELSNSKNNNNGDAIFVHLKQQQSFVRSEFENIFKNLISLETGNNTFSPRREEISKTPEFSLKTSPEIANSTKLISIENNEKEKVDSIQEQEGMGYLDRLSSERFLNISNSSIKSTAKESNKSCDNIDLSEKQHTMENEPFYSTQEVLLHTSQSKLDVCSGVTDFSFLLQDDSEKHKSHLKKCANLIDFTHIEGNENVQAPDNASEHFSHNSWKISERDRELLTSALKRQTELKLSSCRTSQVYSDASTSRGPSIASSKCSDEVDRENLSDLESVASVEKKSSEKSGSLSKSLTTKIMKSKDISEFPDNPRVINSESSRTTDNNRTELEINSETPLVSNTELRPTKKNSSDEEDNEKHTSNQSKKREHPSNNQTPSSHNNSFVEETEEHYKQNGSDDTFCSSKSKRILDELEKSIERNMSSLKSNHCSSNDNSFHSSVSKSRSISNVSSLPSNNGVKDGSAHESENTVSIGHETNDDDDFWV